MKTSIRELFVREVLAREREKKRAVFIDNQEVSCLFVSCLFMSYLVLDLRRLTSAATYLFVFGSWLASCVSVCFVCGLGGLVVQTHTGVCVAQMY
jgi:hypothetical protein